MLGRPRDPGLEKRLLTAAWSLLTAQGYDRLTLAKVAAQAQAHRTDMYRRWPSKAQLVVAALAEHLPPVSAVDTGSLYSDIRALVEDLATSWSAPWMDGLIGLIADLRRDHDADVAFRKMAERRAQPLVDALARAARRGEVREVPDLFLVADLLEGPLMHRQMFTRRPSTPGDLDAVARSVHHMLIGMEVTK